MDFARWLLDGDVPTSVYGTGTSSTAELTKLGVLDNAMLTMNFSKGAICTIAMSRGAMYGYDNRIEVFGDKGTLSALRPLARTCTRHPLRLL